MSHLSTLIVCAKLKIHCLRLTCCPCNRVVQQPCTMLTPPSGTSSCSCGALVRKHHESHPYKQIAELLKYM